MREENITRVLTRYMRFGTSRDDAKDMEEILNLLEALSGA